MDSREKCAAWAKNPPDIEIKNADFFKKLLEFAQDHGMTARFACNAVEMAMDLEKEMKATGKDLGGIDTHRIAARHINDTTTPQFIMNLIVGFWDGGSQLVQMYQNDFKPLEPSRTFVQTYTKNGFTSVSEVANLDAADVGRLPPDIVAFRAFQVKAGADADSAKIHDTDFTLIGTPMSYQQAVADKGTPEGVPKPMASRDEFLLKTREGEFITVKDRHGLKVLDSLGMYETVTSFGKFIQPVDAPEGSAPSAHKPSASKPG